MKKIVLLCLLILPSILFAGGKKEFSVLAFNIWQEGCMVKGGYEAIVENIDKLDPDAVMLVEVRNYKDVDFVAKLIKSLKERGKVYYGKRGEQDVAIITKYKPELQVDINPEKDDSGSVLKSVVNVNGQRIVMYSNHLDYTNYACVLSRGYSGVTWKKLPEPITDVKEILKADALSGRTISIDALIKDAQKEEAKGSYVIIGGDFNEPSHLDWMDDTKDLRGHNGVVVEWPCSKMLYAAGYVDAFRAKYPNAVKYPGFTYPADNELCKIDKLAWFPEADDRERIDFIYYRPAKGIKLKSINVVGTLGDIAYAKRVPQEGKDKIIPSFGAWASDHKAVLATFIIK